MLKIRCYSLILHCVVLFVSFTSISYAYHTEYKGFRKIDDHRVDCARLEKTVVFSKLPVGWRKYAGSVKICSLKQEKTSTANVSIIYIWGSDYFETTGETTTEWKDIPHPIIADKNFIKLGEIPDSMEISNIYYGNWRGGWPTEILIDAFRYVEGNYYYEPLIWNEKKNRYETKDSIKKKGKRPGALDPYAYGAIYPLFSKLNPANCTPLDKNAMLSRLPATWHKYAGQTYEGFVKICALKAKQFSEPKILIISIWTNDYYNARITSTDLEEEKFPLPLILDNDFNIIGQLPEIYPRDDVTSPEIYYGKWHGDRPSEILIDVDNPAVSGDYYYAPLKWNEKKGNYEMTDPEEKNGHRPR